MHLCIWNVGQSKNVHKSVVDPEEVSLEPPLRQNHFIFMENLPKNQQRIINNQVKLTNSPLLRNPGSATASQNAHK